MVNVYGSLVILRLATTHVSMTTQITTLKSLRDTLISFLLSFLVTLTSMTIRLYFLFCLLLTKSHIEMSCQYFIKTEKSKLQRMLSLLDTLALPSHPS